ncbi:MAG: ABC transporter ATP-binding protein [Anaerolineaceae bacterium]|nr:ABC transporter ATP-binding protein [Anaerolineaceae bacterium]MDE0328284.1 ABC transporter ATP-binding protein [Anaerolineaceae bacterium]MDE0608933.1 ABC transporter ATP-binding protein [Anaerolineaceae bacterium]
MTTNTVAPPRAVIRVRNLSRELRLGKVRVHALRDVNLDIFAGEMVSIVGPSGSGKSTLLGLIGGLDSPSSGSVEIDGVDISNMNEDQLTTIRNEKIGFIFQFFNLIPTLTARENVALPVQFANKPKYRPDHRARELLEQLGLGDRMHHRPAELSGGEQQRVAIARALANDPPLLLADEPTGNLDTASGQVVLESLRDVQREAGTTVVLVTHDPELAEITDRQLTLVDGQLLGETQEAQHEPA